MPWLQLLIDTDKSNIPSIEDTLLETGAVCVTYKEFIPEGETEKPILEPRLHETPLWNSTRIIGLYDASIDTHAVNQHLDTSFNSRWEQLEDKDWEREWMNNYHPIQCADNLWICPSWIAPPDPQATNILLDPGLAFGTGTHPTTFLCMQWLAEQQCQNKQIIDYGCGSGILGVAALLLGAKTAIGVDIDPQALIATHDNVQRNHLSIEQFSVHQPQDCPNVAAEIVMANILAGPLVDLSDTITNLLAPSGKLCLSGILAEQAESVIEAYSSVIDFDPIAQKEEWVRLSGQKR